MRIFLPIALFGSLLQFAALDSSNGLTNSRIVAQSLTITGLNFTDTSDFTCSDIKEVIINNRIAQYECYGQVYSNQKLSAMSINFINGSGELPDAQQVPWIITTQSYIFNGTSSIAGNDNAVTSSKAVIVYGIQSGANTATTPTTTQATTATTASTSSTTKSSSKRAVRAASEPVAEVSVVLNYYAVRVQNQQVNKNTQAVVVAVIEGLILGAILAVFLYKMCCFNKKQTGSIGSFTGNTSYSANRTPDPMGPNYYDNAAASYRERGGTGRVSENPRTGTYSYDQPVRMEMQNRPPTSPTVTTQPTLTNARIQSETPALVPVSLTPTTASGGDPLNAWNDKPGGGPTVDSFFS